MTSPPLPLPPARHRFYAVSNALTTAVRRALAQAPCSVATLARAAGVPQSTLARIQAGERQATPAVARAVARALDQWSARCARLARGIRQVHPRRDP
jgi:transcriptional regulator with XRE-family HTH domain